MPSCIPRVIPSTGSGGLPDEPSAVVEPAVERLVGPPSRSRSESGRGRPSHQSVAMFQPGGSDLQVAIHDPALAAALAQRLAAYRQLAHTLALSPRSAAVTTAIKEQRLNIRLDRRTREMLDKAAAYAHVSVSEFVLAHALASAEQVVEAHEAITLQPEDFQAFLDALDAQPAPNAALRRAFERHATRVQSR